MAKTFFVNGNVGNVIVVDDSSGETPEYISTYPVNNSYPFASSTYFHSDFPYLQLKDTLIVASVTFPQVTPDYITWSDGGCDCFSANTLISMADGTHKKICEIQVGDQVLGISKTTNTVTFIEKVPDSLWGYLYSPDLKHKPFITVNHPIYIEGKLTGINPESIQNMYPWLGSVQQLKGFDIVSAPGNLVYNLWVTGDGTYTANGYGTHSIMSTGDFLASAFERGWLTQDQVSEIMIYFTNKGNHVQYGAYLINKMLRYVKPKILLKPLAKGLAKEKSLSRLVVVTVGKMLGRILHPNKGTN